MGRPLPECSFYNIFAWKYDDSEHWDKVSAIRNWIPEKHIRIGLQNTISVEALHTDEWAPALFVVSVSSGDFLNRRLQKVAKIWEDLPS